jgi:hypothetical protein
MIHKSMSVMNRERAVRRTASSGKQKLKKATSYKQQAAGHKKDTNIWENAIRKL